MKAGDHLCLIYDDDPAEQMLALLPYISQGLENGERCVYIADHQSPDQLQGALAEYERAGGPRSERTRKFRL